METKQKQIRLKQLMDNHCLEVDFFPVFQRFLYETSNVYTVTVDLEGEVLAPSCFGEEEESEYVRSVLSTELIEEAVSLARNNFLEDIIPMEIEEKGAICQGILLKVNGIPNGVLCVLGFLEDGEANPERPGCIRLTENKRYQWVLREYNASC